MSNNSNNSINAKKNNNSTAKKNNNSAAKKNNTRTAKKRISFSNIINTNTTYSKNNYSRANLVTLKKNMNKGRIAVSIGKATAYLQQRNVTPNNISEPRLLSQSNAARLSATLSKIKQNKTRKIRQVLRDVQLEKNNVKNNAKRRKLNTNATTSEETKVN
jgi:hypothetical protein